MSRGKVAVHVGGGIPDSQMSEDNPQGCHNVRSIWETLSTDPPLSSNFGKSGPIVADLVLVGDADRANCTDSWCREDQVLMTSAMLRRGRSQAMSRSRWDGYSLPN